MPPGTSSPPYPFLCHPWAYLQRLLTTRSCRSVSPSAGSPSRSTSAAQPTSSPSTTSPSGVRHPRDLQRASFPRCRRRVCSWSPVSWGWLVSARFAPRNDRRSVTRGRLRRSSARIAVRSCLCSPLRGWSGLSPESNVGGSGGRGDERGFELGAVPPLSLRRIERGVGPAEQPLDLAPFEETVVDGNAGRGGHGDRDARRREGGHGLADPLHDDARGRLVCLDEEDGELLPAPARCEVDAADRA